MKKPRGFKHGGVGTTEYNSWRAMLNRVRHKSFEGYKNYGGRGVGVTPRWHSFANFLADMGKKPTAKHSLDRIDNDKGYGPQNCRWVTHEEQQNNRRNNTRVLFRGRLMTVPQLSKRYGLSRAALYTVLVRKGPDKIVDWVEERL
jgi:hypothetical protein